MKIFYSAEFEAKALEPLYEVGEIELAGWALGLPNLSEEELIARTKDADMIVTTFDDITRAVIENAKNLKLIACTRATPVNIDIAAAKERNIPVLFTPGRNSDATAELTIGLMLSIARKIPMAHAALKAGEYTAPPESERVTKDGLRPDVFWGVGENAPYSVFQGTQLHGKTLGIVGYGSIGRRVGRIARAIGMALLIYDPYVGEIDVEEFGVRKAASLKELMSESDFVSCHLKVAPDTVGCISKEMIACMKPTAYFINASRSAILDEQALVEALRERRIAGAALDVYEKEPIVSNHPFITELDNVVITPHIAGAAEAVMSNHTKMIVGEIKRFLNGEKLLYRYA
ncbi:MAG: 2-hydroxyacid dehydrogenase [Clostridia bacterium]|nr:2-hydroxyacid dehydrogenase [Clostridia bacterium]